MTDTHEVDPSAELTEFFDTIWGNDVEGFVYLPTKEFETDKWKSVFYEWPRHKAHVVRHVLAATSTNHEVYFAPSIFKRPDPHKENVLGSRTIWVDFDGNAPKQAADGLEGQMVQEGGDAPSGAPDPAPASPEGIPAATMRVQSSADGHQHFYWNLAEFSYDPSFIENSNRALAYGMKADTSGWDANQILRPPHTHNYKRNLPVVLKFKSNERVKADQFAQLAPPKQLVSQSIDTDNLPKVEALVAKYQWDEEHFELFSKPEIEQGQRSSALMRMAYACCEMGMTDVEAYAILDNADLRWGKFKNRNDRKQRLLDAVNRARIKHPVAVGEVNFAGLLNSSAEVGRKYIYGFQELLDSEIKIEWAIEGLIEMTGIGMLTSLPGVGKTQWSLRLGIACALGIPFLRYKPLKKMKVLFLSLEMNHPAIKSFLETMAKTLSGDELRTLEQNFKIVPLGETIPLDTAEGRAFLEGFLEEYKPDAVFIDSMGKVTFSELTDEKKIKELNGYYGKIRSKFGCFLWFIHHNRKPNETNKKPKALSDLYGSQYIAAEASVVLNLWREEDTGELEVSAIKMRLMKEPKPYHIARTEHLEFNEVERSVGQGLVSHVGKDSNDGTTSGAQPTGKPGNSNSVAGL
jgi:hypothetical protein